jgi:hypothetical protein
MKRRTFLKILGGSTAALALPHPLLAATATRQDDFFIFIHAAGGWDVTLWSDPRNERKGIVEPASSDNTDIGGIKLWKKAALDGDTSTFEILTPTSSSMRFGPGIGDLYDMHDRLTVINGIAMNTVSHDDGTVYSATGRHPSGGIVPESSIDVLIASELGTQQLMPDVSIKFPSFFVGDKLDRRAIPLHVATVEAITKAFARSDQYLGRDDRDAITSVLTEEAQELADRSTHRATFDQLASQHQALPQLLSGEFTKAFSARQLQESYPQFNYQGTSALKAAFTAEALRRNVVRCVSFGVGGFDTHNVNYRRHAHILQELFGTLASLLKVLDETPHPTLNGAKLGDRTHVLVVSDFCRAPQINFNSGRDHYPNNSALVISPRFKRGRTFGQTDHDQVLPTEFGTFVGGRRALTPPDVLATFLGAFGIDPRRYMRDGEVVKEMLA